MAYPTIPLVSFYGDQIEFDLRANRIEQSKGGVIDRSAKHAINATRKTYSISATLRDRDELQTFLENNRGLPFEFLYDGKSDPSLYVCKSWNWSWLVYAEGNGVWKFTGNLEQVYRPGYIKFRSESSNLVFAPVQLSGVGEVASDFQPVGTGNLQTSPVVVSGSGAYTGVKTGSGNLLVSSVTLSGVGSITLTGSGAIEISAPVMAGSGTAGPPVIGSGDLSTDAIELSGTGSFVREGSGSLVIVVPTMTGTGNLIMTGSGAIETASISISGAGSIIPNSTLLNDLLWWYSLNEASGNRADSHTGGYTLTQNGTVGSTAGKVGNAANFANDATNNLSSTNPVFRFGNTTFYGACWIRIESASGVNQNILSRWNFGSNNRSYQLTFTTSNQLVWAVSSSGTSSTLVVQSLSTATTAFVEFYHDATSDLIGLALNGGSFTTTAFSGGLFVGTAPLRIGRYDDASSNSPYIGWVDEFAMWSRILNSTERTTLYNGGAGIIYPG